MAFAMMRASQLDHFRSVGAMYAGFCPLDMAGRPSTASVCVYQLPTEGAVEDTLAEIKAALERKYRDDDIQIIELPCGRGGRRPGRRPPWRDSSRCAAAPHRTRYPPSPTTAWSPACTGEPTRSRPPTPDYSRYTYRHRFLLSSSRRGGHGAPFGPCCRARRVRRGGTVRGVLLAGLSPNGDTRGRPRPESSPSIASR